MAKLIMEKKLKDRLIDTYRRLDDDLKELEEIQKEMDKMLYDIERRITRLRRPRGA